MKQRFTKLLAAFALLVGLAIPMGMWGQTRVEKNVTYSWNSNSKAFVKETTTNDAVDEITPSTTTTGSSQSSAGPTGDKKAAVQLMSPNNGTPRGTFVFTLSDFPYEVIGISFNYYTTSGNKSGTMTATLDDETFAAHTSPISSNNSWSDQALTVTGNSSGDETLVVSANYTTNSVYVHSLTVTYTANVDPVDPTITFNNGSVYVGQTLDLSTLFTSNSSGAVTYSIISGGTYATLNNSSILTGVAVGSVTVKASQAATSSYNAGEATATIAVTEYVQPTQFDVALNNVAFGCEIGNNAVEQSFTTNNTEFVAGCSSSASSKTYYDANHVRFYAGSYLNITAPEGYIITKTVFTADVTWSGGISANSGTYNNDTKTWEGGTDQLNFSFAAQNRISSVAITLAVPSAEYTITYATNLTNGSFAEGNPTSASAGVPVTVLTIPDEGYCLASMTYNDGTTTENATVNGNSGIFTMPELNVTVSATFRALTFTNYQLVSSMSEMVSGKHYIIVSENAESYYAMGSQNNNNRDGVEINVNDGIASVSDIDPVREVVINGPNADGFYIIYDAEEPGYLYAAGGNDNNYLKTQNFNNNKGQWNISIEDGVATVVANADGRNNMLYNSSSGIFSCYNSGQKSISLYVKDNETEYTYITDIKGYGQSTNGGYTLIASPIGGVNPADVAGMTVGDFDLYRFNESADLEWENWKQQGDHNHFNLERGKGYLYAHKTDVTLAFAGTPAQGTSFDVTLSNDGNDVYKGMNLVGNPFGQRAYVNLPFYVMNSEDSGFEAADRNYVGPMEGIIVDAENGGTVTFTTEAPSNGGGSKVALNLSRNRGDVIDRAIVRFGEGSQLHKFQLRENSTKVYFTEGNQDFAVVSRDVPRRVTTEIPVNFEAEENGTYTLSVSTEEIELNYLHLIDNLTGADVDLLAPVIARNEAIQEPASYTFDARTTDYPSRFRLVFSANGTDENETTTNFAYITNGEIHLVDPCHGASLQVIDMMGRIILCRDGVHTVSTSGIPAGVYVLRLIDGDNVKTQKMVVR